MEPLPRGANFVRAKMLWEIGLHIAGNPLTPYYGNRDLCIAVGSGSGEAYKPWLRMATGSPVLAHAVAKGDLDLAIVNPSGMLTQAYRGKGLFAEPLPVRVVANYPSWDRFVFVFHPRTGIRSFAELKAKRPALRLSIREDRTHSTRGMVDQALAAHGLSLAELESWGGTLQLNGGPGDARRMKELAAGTLDAIFDEGLPLWLEDALAAGMRPVEPEAGAFRALEAMGWRRVVIRAGQFRGLAADYACIDYSGWPLYTRASLPDEDAYKICDAIAARAGQIVWENWSGNSPFEGLAPLCRDTEATPLDVPLHPGAERWYREQGLLA